MLIKEILLKKKIIDKTIYIIYQIAIKITSKNFIYSS